MKLRAFYNNFLFRPISVGLIALAVFSLFGGDWPISIFALLSVFLLGIVASSMYPEKSAKELAKGSTLDSAVTDQYLLSQEPKLVGKAIQRFFFIILLMTFAITYFSKLENWLFLTAVAPFVIIVAIFLVYGSIYRFFIEGSSK